MNLRHASCRDVRPLTDAVIAQPAYGAVRSIDALHDAAPALLAACIAARDQLDGTECRCNDPICEPGRTLRQLRSAIVAVLGVGRPYVG